MINEIDYFAENPALSERSLLNIETVNKLKLIGNEFFKKHEYNLAIEKYCKALKYLEAIFWIAIIDEINPIKITLLLNKSQCYLNLKRPIDTIMDCKEVLELDNRNIKALFRISEANIQLNKFQEAFEYSTLALTYSPNEKAIQQQLELIKKKI
eukprot:TRINITY_DN5278_c2_g1_i1.p1 TRINITY_DN5278_c2_g1~~TRINITY_DN5278_c2_g1_i1.p1  ORF type:complete len:154 (-),score=35.67 TRINITY_DN5278_c2_g1_i1:35-496(-)